MITMLTNMLMMTRKITKMSFKMFDLIFMLLTTVPSVCNKRHTSCGDVSLIANKAISDSYESPRHTLYLSPAIDLKSRWSGVVTCAGGENTAFRRVVRGWEDRKNRNTEIPIEVKISSWTRALTVIEVVRIARLSGRQGARRLIDTLYVFPVAVLRWSQKYKYK